MKLTFKRISAILLTIAMIVSCMGALSVSAASDKQRYTKEEKHSSLISDAKINIYTTTDGGTVALTGSSGSTFTQLSGWREFTATANEGWVFDGWTTYIEFENLFNKREAVNRHNNGYSYSNSHSDWDTAYDGESATISANRLVTWGEVAGNPIRYTMWANFNPTVTATEGENGTFTAGTIGASEVEYGYDSDTYTIKANTGFTLDTVLVDGVAVDNLPVNAISYAHQFRAVTEPHTITFTTKEIPAPPAPTEYTLTVDYVDAKNGNDTVAAKATVDNGKLTWTWSWPDDATHSDATFKGWCTAENGTGTCWNAALVTEVNGAQEMTYFSETHTDTALTYYAIWEENTTVNPNPNPDTSEPSTPPAPEMAVVTFDFATEGKADFDVTAEVGTVINLPTAGKVGYTFGGWKAADGTVHTGQYTVAADATLTAQWTKQSEPTTPPTTPPTTTPTTPTAPTTKTYEVAVKYVDASGATLADTVVYKGYRAGDTYTTTGLTIDGYTLTEVKGVSAGTISADVVVTYVYATSDVVIPDEDTPLADGNENETSGVVIPDESTPLAPAPEVVVPEDDVPLADIPQTGDVRNLAVMLVTTMLSALGLAIALKRERDAHNQNI